MKIGTMDVRAFNAVQLTADIQPAQDGVNVEWIEGAAQPTEGKTTATFGTLELVLYFRGKNRNQITQHVAQLLALLQIGKELELDGYRGHYRAYLQSSKRENVAGGNTRQKLTLKFNGYLHDDAIAVEYQGITAATLHRTGARPSPCVVTITPAGNLAEYTLDGFNGEAITVTNLKAGVPVKIDTVAGTCTENGKNKGPEVDMWVFPTLDAETTDLTFSDARPTVRIEYTPIWL